jgi:hypothetical protein
MNIAYYARELRDGLRAVADHIESGVFNGTVRFTLINIRRLLGDYANDVFMADGDDARVRAAAATLANYHRAVIDHLDDRAGEPEGFGDLPAVLRAIADDLDKEINHEVSQ